VPGAGVLLAGWTSTTALLLYWWETFFGIVLLYAIFARYRAVTRDQAGAPRDQVFQAARGGTIGTALVFTIAQAYFLGAIVVWISQHQHTPIFVPDLWRGAAAVGAFLIAETVVDLQGLRGRSLEWLKQLGGAEVGRMIVMQFTIVGGGLAFAIFGHPRWLFVVFIGFKLLLDLAFWSERAG
jgi:hypothetical protein